MNSILFLLWRDVPVHIENREQVACMLTISRIFLGNDLCLFGKWNIDCSMCFLTAINQSPLGNALWSKIGNIDK